MGNENECIPWLNELECTKDHKDNESYEGYLHDQRPKTNETNDWWSWQHYMNGCNDHESRSWKHHMKGCNDKPLIQMESQTSGHVS